ncbi:MAG: hypothetical protein ACLUBJ_07390 [Veillonella atypica]|uniref:hypothetical protein n=1 Tax=Veillonella atypica TaxID=39777 RepID=UPI003992A80E
MRNFDNPNYEKYKKMSEDEFRLRVAELEVKISEIGLGLIKEYASGGLKALLLLNGAAGIAILAFLGNILGTEFERWIRGIAWGLVFFSIGAFFSTISWLFAYISQTYYNEANGNDKMIKNGTIWRNATVGAVVVSGIAFLVGGYLIFYVITSY